MSLKGSNIKLFVRRDFKIPKRKCSEPENLSG